jgi:primosomal protein N' (replication factor Y)
MIARVTLDMVVRKEFDYLVPAELTDRVEVGTRVKVPFGPRQVLGCVTAMLDQSPHAKLRPILQIVGRQSLVTPKVLELASWMAGYYCCPVEVALRSVLPEAVRKEKEGWRERLVVRALSPVSLPKLTQRQNELWQLISARGRIPMQDLLREAACTTQVIRRLEDKGLVTVLHEVAERDPYAHEQILPSQPLSLNSEQQAALNRITAALDKNEASVFLLHGVTGSGKTEVYLQALSHTLASGRGAIVLVPEISLTPQTVERFKARFCSGPLQTLVAVLHSHLSAGERHDEWHKIRQGRARVVIGARSALFAPVDPLGLIIVDEEHEGSYKQEEAPRYHARDVAVVRGRMEKAAVLLGSATPSLESFHNARRGKYVLLEMPTRVDDKKMPLVRVVDLRKQNRKQKGMQLFSPPLKEAILQRLERKEQVILFLNRRGYSTSVQCPQCGFVMECPNCSVALTYHRHRSQICCHICGHAEPPPKACPQPDCKHPGILFAGFGTERVEETLGKLFPQARSVRMDSDVLKRKEDYRRILGEFRRGKIDILLGTQMIAKGLHFPNVTLVGIVYADLSLHLPDFRAAERTFQLLTQVAGRAGRGDVEGEVFVQSLTPFHPAIQYARRHDFLGFYEQEIEFRAPLHYPPLSRIALLTLRGRNEDKVRFWANHLKSELETRLHGWKGVILAGPAPAPLARAESHYRYQLMIRTPFMTKLGPELANLRDHSSLPDDVTLVIDIDPVNLV